MRMNYKLAVLCAVASIGMTVVALAAENEQGRIDIESAMKSGEILPLDEIIQRAKSQISGRVTEIELGYDQNRYVYEIDVMDESGVKTELKLDAKTAELLSSEIDDDDEDEIAEAGGDEEDK